MAKSRKFVALGRLGGKATSDAKARAVRENGKLGGRPRQWWTCPTHGRCRGCATARRDGAREA
jgi:hypothetical protein